MKSKAEPTKQAVIGQLIEARQAILEAASALPVEKQAVAFLGVWSIKDLLAHLIGWDFANIEAVQAIPGGNLPAFYAHHDHDWQSFNARLVAEHKRGDYAELLAATQDSHRQLIAVLETIPAEAFDKDYAVRFRGYKVTIARTLLAEAKDERTHHGQIQTLVQGSNPSVHE